MEERLFHLPSNADRVTVGEDRHNDFVIDGDRMPRSFELFRRVSGGYALRLLGGMTGILKSDEHEDRIEDRAGETLFIGAGYRGLIHLGGVSLFFQFVEAPTKPPRRRLLSGFSGSLAVALWFSLVAQFALLVLAQVLDDEVPPEQSRYEEHYPYTVVPAPPPEPDSTT